MDARGNLIYPIPAPDGSQIIPKKQWLWSKERTLEALEKNELEITKGNDGDWVVSTKQYLKDEDGSIRKGKMFSIIDDVYTQHGTNEMIDILGNAKVFQYPKPSEFIKRLLNIGSNEKCTILDFFSGSATTAHAVMQLNAEDGGNRKFIMVQLPEPCKDESEAFKAGYKNICEIGKERIRRAGEKIIHNSQCIIHNEGNEQTSLENNCELSIMNYELDLGFKVLKLDSSNIRKWQPNYDNLELSLKDFVNNYVEGRSELDVVYEIMLKYGLDLTYPVDEHSIGGKKVYSIGLGMLMICLDDNLTTDVAKGILKLKDELKPESIRVVFKDNGFNSDSNKTNIKEILKAGGVEEFVTV